MLNFKDFLLSILLLALFNSYLFAQSTELKKEFRVTKKLFKENKYSDALISNNKAITLSKKEFGDNHLTTATLLENKGRLYLEIGKYRESEIIFEEVIKIRKILINKNNPDTAEALNYLALALRKQYKLDKAILIHNEVLTMMGNVIANNPSQISELTRRSALYRARAYHTKGELLIRDNKPEEAKGNFTIAIKIFERTLGPNKKELQDLLNKMDIINK